MKTENFLQNICFLLQPFLTHFTKRCLLYGARRYSGTPATHCSELLNGRMLGRMLMHSFGFDDAQFGEIAECCRVARLQA